MSLQDAFWGTRLVLSFTDEQIRAVAATGEFSDPDAARFLADVLIRRRDKIARHWLSDVNPLDRFHVRGDAAGGWHLESEDLELAQDLVRAEDRRYEYSVRAEGPSTGLRTGAGRPLIARQQSHAPSVSLDVVTRDDSVYRVPVWTQHRGRQQGERIDVYLRRRNGAVEIIGIDREE